MYWTYKVTSQTRSRLSGIYRFFILIPNRYTFIPNRSGLPKNRKNQFFCPPLALTNLKNLFLSNLIILQLLISFCWDDLFTFFFCSLQGSSFKLLLVQHLAVPVSLNKPLFHTYVAFKEAPNINWIALMLVRDTFLTEWITNILREYFWYAWPPTRIKFVD